MLVWALLVVAPCSPVRAESAVARLLKPLDLVAYASGTAPPHFSGSTIDTRRVSMTDLRGKVVLMNFWASWCAECRPETTTFLVGRDGRAVALAVGARAWASTPARALIQAMLAEPAPPSGAR